MHLHFVQLIVLMTVLPKFARAADDYYLDEVQETCEKTNGFISCAKYKFLDFFSRQYYRIPDYNITSDRTWRIVDFVNPTIGQKGMKFKSRADNKGSDEGELTKIAKYVARQTGRLANTKGISIELPESAKIIDKRGSRGKKKKMLLLSFLSFIKLIKIDFTVGLIMTGVVIIKKMLILGAFVIPGWLWSIKNQCKKAAASTVHVVPYHVEDEESHHHHDGGADYDSGPWRRKT